MMKKAKAFTLVEMLVVITIIGILAAMLLPVIAAKHRQEQKIKVVLNVGDVVCIPSLSITGIVNHIDDEWFNYVSILVRSTNGLPTKLERIDGRLLQKIPPSPESEWKH